MADGYQSDFLNICKKGSSGVCFGASFINYDFNSYVRNNSVHLYADDTVIYSVAPSVDLTLQNLQSDLCVILKALFLILN